MKASDAIKSFEDYLRVRNYSHRTINGYCSSVSMFFSYLSRNKSISNLEHSKRVENYLTWRVKKHDISKSTQNVDFNALIRFYAMLGIELSGIDALRAKRKNVIPPILSRDHISIILKEFQDDLKLVPALLYGCAMRVNEVLRLRVKDIDFQTGKISIHEAKGDKDRLLEIPESLTRDLEEQIEKALGMWKEDIFRKFNGVNCGGIEKKYPKYPFSKEWYWLFPANSLSENPMSKIPYMRHHVMDFTIQRIFGELRKKYDLPIYTSAHKLRHASLTHMAEDMLRNGFPEKMIKQHLKSIAGHVMDMTIEGYIHLAAPKNFTISSPIDRLNIR